MISVVVIIRPGETDDFERVNAFYEFERGVHPASQDDLLVLATDGESVVGVVRLCDEESHLVLRTMLVSQAYRGMGIGLRMLRVVETQIRNRDCYCLPWSHLERFYQTVGFAIVQGSKIPRFLADRLDHYEAELQDAGYQSKMQELIGVFPPDGLRFVCMKRPAT